jgi:hypothetical protein
MAHSTRRSTLAIAALAALAAATSAAAQPATKRRPPPPPVTMPSTGDSLALAGTPGWPALDWLYDVPSRADAAGRIVVHWFCSPRVKECADDLARLIALRDTDQVYIVAYIDGAQPAARKLDPIRDSEGVGRGTVAFGAGVTALATQLGIAGTPTSIIVDVDGKVAAVASGATADALAARDARVTALAGKIRPFTTAFESTAAVKAGAPFTFKVTVQLASWLAYAWPMRFELTAPRELQCNARSLADAQLQPDGHTLVAAVTCTAPRGVYEAQGRISFRYTTPARATGIGEDGASWKFEVTP